MNIELKILEHGKEFYKKGEYLLSNPPQQVYDLPVYVTPGSAAMDLRVTEDVTLMPGERKRLSTGLAIWIGSRHSMAYVHKETYRGEPELYAMSLAGLILPRSGLGTKGLVLANTIGLIDEDYQGELMISAWNSNMGYHSSEDDYYFNGEDDIPFMREYWTRGNKIELKAGDRIAQLVFIPVIKASWKVVDEFSEITERGQGGFGSTDSR